MQCVFVGFDKVLILEMVLVVGSVVVLPFVHEIV